jgi:hypothetical protein
MDYRSLLNQLLCRSSSTLSSWQEVVGYDVYSHHDQRRIRYHHRGRCAIPSFSLSTLLSFDLEPGRPVGGTAGCVVAGRLAAADPDLRILILEAGPATHNDPIHTRPALFLSHLAPGSRTARVHTSPPTAGLGGRSALVPCGQCLGGGGSINCKSPSQPCFSRKVGGGGKKMEETEMSYG